MQREITDYKMICQENSLDFESGCMEFIKDGYQLYGNPFSIGSPDGRYGLCQAMVKYKETECSEK